MRFLGESEDGWCYKVETNRELITQDLDLAPKSHLDLVETRWFLHVAKLTHEIAEIAVRLLQENLTNCHIFVMPEHSEGLSLSDQ